MVVLTVGELGQLLSGLLDDEEEPTRAICHHGTGRP